MRDGMRLPIVLLLIAAPATAQLFTYGLKIGAPLTDPSGNVATSRSYSVGPSVEFALPNRFAVEASAILHHFSSTSLVDVQSDPQTTPTIASRIRGNAWEFPFLAKRYFGHPSARVNPCAGAGVAFRTIGYQFGGTTQSILSGTNLLAVPTPLTPSTHAPAPVPVPRSRPDFASTWVACCSFQKFATPTGDAVPASTRKM